MKETQTQTQCDIKILNIQSSTLEQSNSLIQQHQQLLQQQLISREKQHEELQTQYNVSQAQIKAQHDEIETLKQALAPLQSDLDPKNDIIEKYTIELQKHGAIIKQYEADLAKALDIIKQYEIDSQTKDTNVQQCDATVFENRIAIQDGIIENLQCAITRLSHSIEEKNASTEKLALQPQIAEFMRRYFPSHPVLSLLATIPDPKILTSITSLDFDSYTIPQSTFHIAIFNYLFEQLPQLRSLKLTGFADSRRLLTILTSNLPPAIATYCSLSDDDMIKIAAISSLSNVTIFDLSCNKTGVLQFHKFD